MRWGRPSVLRREILFAVLVVACGLGVLRRIPGLPAMVIEAALVVAMSSILFAVPEIATIVRRISRARRTILACLPAAVLIGHFHGKLYDTFPFVPWDIYQVALAGDAQLFAYYAVHRDGSEEELIPAELFPALDKKLAVELEQVAHAADSADDAGRRADLLRRYDNLLLALAGAYNHRHSVHPLVAIRIERWIVPTDHYAGRESILRTAFRVWSLAGEQR
ncbi:MAG: hypothetical protein HY270_05395 [Deltaproteobacteria bacterium]|nr:hypothetical protein [Deltaproteobacteria bacterium]